MNPKDPAFQQKILGIIAPIFDQEDEEATRFTMALALSMYVWIYRGKSKRVTDRRRRMAMEELMDAAMQLMPGNDKWLPIIMAELRAAARERMQ